MITQFEIDRSKWRFANHGNGITNLLNSYGYMCCLGFLGRACGIKDSELSQVGKPSQVDDEWKKLFPIEFQKYTVIPGMEESIQSTLIEINDHLSNNIINTREERESWLIAGFKYMLSIDVTFTGCYND